ncbi:HAD-IA family hydrolase [Lentibacillus halophilus]|uniref:HAD-IA family hydrolase n=1 Tax=Lentibacillus halophilus TaxID=295065 RepID=A0ABN0Z5S2_9BACI
MVKAIIFDLDDTLISERGYIKSGYYHIARLLSNRYNEDEEKLYNLLSELFNDNPRYIFNRLFDKLGIAYTKSDILEMVNEYRNHSPRISFYSDVLPFINLLKKRYIKTGIITDGYANAQHQKLKAVQANNHFDEIIVTDDLGKNYWKPHPMPFEIMKEKLNVSFDEMVYIGDNPEKDFYISNIYPIKAVRIIRNDSVYKNASYYKAVQASFKINSLSDLNTHLIGEK